MNTIDEKTFKQGLDEFIGCAPEGGWSDYWAMQQDWEFYKDSLCRDGVITQKQADSWSNPCTPDTFARWQKRNGLTRRGYESKKSEGHDTIVDYFHSDPEVENSEALEDLTITVSDNGCETDSVMEDGESSVELCTWLPDGTSVAITVGICDDGNNDKATYAIDVGKTIGRSPITAWDKAYTADELSQMWVDFEDDLKKVIAEHPVGESKKEEPKGESESKQNEKSKAVCAVCGEPIDDPVFDYDHTFCKDCYGDGGDVWKGDKANANAKFVVGTMISLDGVKQYIREFRPRTFVAQSVDTGKEVTLPRSSLNRAFVLYDPRKSDYDDRGNLKNRESKKKGESKKSEGIGDRIKMGIDYNMFMRMCGSAAYLDDNEDYWDALWEYYSEMGEIEDALVFFDNLFQYTAWCDVDELYDEYLDDAYKDKSKSKETCIQEAVDGGDLDAYKHSGGKYLVIL